MVLKKGFLLAAFIYLFNSIGNVSQGVFIKYYQDAINIGLYELITLKCLISMIIMLPFSYKYLKHWKENLYIVLMLAVLYSLDVLTCNIGLKTVPVNTGVLILLLVPLWVIFFGRVILNEKKFNIINALMIAICLLAIGITVWNEVSFNGFNSGYIFLFADSIIIPLGLILQKKFSDSRPVAYALLTNAIVLGIISFCMSGFKVPDINSANLKASIFIALFDLLEFGSVYVAYKMTDVALLQPIRFTRIVISMLLSYIVLSETPTKYQTIGAIMVIIANVISIVYSKKKQDY